MRTTPENLTGATSCVCDIAGVSIIGLGKGADRPTLTYATSANATISVTAANVTIKNLLFVGNVANVVAGITVAGTDCTIDSCEWQEGTNLNFKIGVAVGAAANDSDGLIVRNCIMRLPDTDGH